MSPWSSTLLLFMAGLFGCIVAPRLLKQLLKHTNTSAISLLTDASLHASLVAGRLLVILWSFCALLLVPVACIVLGGIWSVGLYVLASIAYYMHVFVGHAIVHGSPSDK